MCSKINNEDKKVLESIFGKLSTEKWKCKWMKCAHGMGLAGRGRCTFGDPLDEHCLKFEDEDEFLQNWKEEYLNQRRM